MRKLERMARTLNDEFRDHLAAAVREKHGIDVETGFNLFSGALSTSRSDGEDFTPEQMAYIEAWMAGFGKALEMVRAADRGVLDMVGGRTHGI